MLTDLHNRISELERGQAVSALRVSDTAVSHAGTSPSVVIHNQSSVSQSVSQPATTTVSVGSQFSSQATVAASSNPAAASVGPSLTSIRTQAEVEHQRVFGYMPRSDTQVGTFRRKASSRGQQPTAKKRKYKPTWTRVFVCLANTSDSRMPSATYYRELKRASLGEKSVTFNIADTSVEFDYKLKMEFPKLEMAGGYLLMCSHNSTRTLEEIKPPYNVQRLKRETGQCKIFIRPLQSDLDLTPDACEEEKEVKLSLTNLQCMTSSLEIHYCLQNIWLFRIILNFTHFKRIYAVSLL